ncbi:MAG: type II secretion system protein GspM [Chromatiales bacterium]
MNRPMTTWSHRLLALALLLTLAASAYYGPVLALMAAHERYNEEIDNTALRLQKLRGIAAEKATLERRLAARGPAGLAKTYQLQGSTEALAAAALQDHVRALVQEAGGKLKTTNPLPVTAESGLTRIGVSARMTLDVTGLQKMLHGIETGTPLVFVDKLAVRPGRETFQEAAAARADIELLVDMDVSAYARNVDAAE